MAEINFDGLKMTIRSENLKTGNTKEHEYFEQKDFEKVFNIPVKPVLENDVEDSLVDGENGEVVSSFVLPSKYEKEDVEKYKKFLADAFNKAREAPGFKLVEIRRNKNQKTTIIIEQK